MASSVKIPSPLPFTHEEAWLHTTCGWVGRVVNHSAAGVIVLEETPFMCFHFVLKVSLKVEIIISILQMKTPRLKASDEWENQDV